MAYLKSMTTRKTIKSKVLKKTKGGEYKILKSIESDSLNYVSKRFGEIVTAEIEDGWTPYGNPLILIEDDKYIMLQSMTKGVI